MDELQESYIDSNVSFLPYGIKDMLQLIMTRRENLKITDMLWINKKAVIDGYGECYNPKALIMIFLN